MNNQQPKVFINADELIADSCQLAKQVLDHGFVPDYVLGLWRGGALIAISIHEILSYMQYSVNHGCVKTSFYKSIGETFASPVIDSMAHVRAEINAQTKLLVVDDVCESGRTLKAMIDAIATWDNAPDRKYIKIAVPWYKPDKSQTEIVPDFYLHTTDQWLVFPHEMVGLSEDEIIKNKPYAHRAMATVRRKPVL